jgi:hypothetical protein
MVTSGPEALPQASADRVAFTGTQRRLSIFERSLRRHNECCRFLTARCSETTCVDKLCQFVVLRQRML